MSKHYIISENEESQDFDFAVSLVLERDAGARKIEWDEYEDEQLIAQGGVCIEHGCNCNKVWEHWRVAR